MGFDLSTARPEQAGEEQITAQSGGFDLSTATPEAEEMERITPEPKQPAGRSRGGVKQRNADISEGKNLLNLLDQGVLNVQGLTDKQQKNLEVERIKAIPELADVGLNNFLGESGLDSFVTAAVGLTAFKPEEFGQIISSRHPHIGITTTKDGQTLAVNNETGTVVNLNKPGLSMFDMMQGLGVVSAFTPASRATATAPAAVTRLIGQQAPKTATRVGAGGLAAGATETAIQGAQEQAGGTFDARDAQLAAVLGGGAELVGPLLSAPINKVRQGRRAAEETAEQTARRELFESEKLTPTRAQVTRDPQTFQDQVSISKTDPSGGIAQQLEGQAQTLQQNLQQVGALTGGRTITSESAPINEIVSRSIAVDDKISQLYKEARRSSPRIEDIKTARLNALVRRMSGQDRLSGGVVSGIKGELIARGIMDKAGKSTGRKIGTAEAEELRATINTFFKESGDTAPRGNQLIREFKDALDKDVFQKKGTDLFDQARSAKAEFEQSLNKAKISKFDADKTNLVRDILNNKRSIDEDRFVQDTIFKNAFRKQDISQLKLFLNQTESGKAAWKDVRAQTVAEIEERIFRGPVGPDGITQALSRAQVEGVINKLGGKIDVVLTPAEKKFLFKLRDISKLREPPGVTGAGAGPTEVAVQKGADRVSDPFGIFQTIFRKLSNARKNQLLKRLPRARGTTKPDVDLRGPTQAAQTGRQTENNKRQQSGRNRPR